VGRAMSRFRRGRLSWVIADIGTLNDDSPDSVKRLKAAGAAAVIVLTKRNGCAYFDAARELGADFVLSMSAPLKDLFDLIGQVRAECPLGLGDTPG